MPGPTGGGGSRLRQDMEVRANLLEALQRSITCSGRLLLAIEPWQQPTALSRSWCLYELYIAFTNNVKVSACLAAEDQWDFVQALRQGKGTVASILAAVDARQARATVVSDQEMIMSAIGAVGVDMFNEFIKQRLTASLQLTALHGVLTDMDASTASTSAAADPAAAAPVVSSGGPAVTASGQGGEGTEVVEESWEAASERPSQAVLGSHVGSAGHRAAAL